MNLGLTDRVALVLGSTSGLGWASAEALAAEGARVVVVGRRADLVEERAASLPEATGVVADLTDPGAATAVVSAAREAYGQVDVVVLNGGGPAPSTALDFSSDDASAAAQLLVVPHVAVLEQLLPAMREAGWGRVIAIGSSGVQQPIPTLTASNVGRAALAAYLKTLAGAVAKDGVTVNMVLPGRIDTDRVASLDSSTAERTSRSVDEVRTQAESTIPTGRYGRPEEFAAIVTFLASDLASYVTGEQIRCDGGLVAGY